MYFERSGQRLSNCLLLSPTGHESNHSLRDLTMMLNDPPMASQLPPQQQPGSEADVTSAGSSSSASPGGGVRFWNLDRIDQVSSHRRLVPLAPFTHSHPSPSGQPAP